MADQVAMSYITERRQAETLRQRSDELELQNARMRQQDRHVHDLEALPATLSRTEVRAWLDPLSAPPTRTLYDDQGREIAAARLAAIAANAAVDAVAEQVRAADLARDPALAALYCWSQGELRRMADGITVSNGLGWSPDGRTMYWSDTKSHTVHAFDVDGHDGSLSRRRVFASFPVKQAGQPLDGYDVLPIARLEKTTRAEALPAFVETPLE